MRLPLCLLLFAATASAQTGQTVRGTVLDRDTRAPLVGATVVVADTAPLLGASTDAEGRFVLAGVPLGRQTLLVRYLGYETRALDNVLVRAGQETVLEIALAEQVVSGTEVVVEAEALAGRPRNDMAAVSARSFSVEETRRYAGAVDDPARLAAAFAGVAPTGSGVQDNALAIRGNAPRGVLWRVEGVDVPNPNHFAGLSVAGGGGVTLFSGQLLADSDVFTGAFPAEYGNALSGVFDVRFRTGNPATREHTLQAGLLGVEAASEGPVRLGAPSTYLVNYRYSTLGLLMPLLPTEGGVAYQDLSFKLAFPTRRAGRIEVWGLGGLDGQSQPAERDSTAWESLLWDRTEADLTMGVGAAGLTHHLVLGSRSYLRTHAAATVQHTAWDQAVLGDDLALRPDLSLRSTDTRLNVGTALTHKAGAGLVHEAGVSLQELLYDLDLRAAPVPEADPVPVAIGDGRSALVRAFAQSRWTPAPDLDLTAGLHAQRFLLTDATAVEPRLGATWAVTPRQTVTLGYGLHSQIEDLRVYLARPNGVAEPNRDLGPARSHHLVVGTSRQLTEAVRLGAEGYVQRLFDVPVIADSSFALLNVRQDWTFAEPLVNDGAGENVGVEVTVERPFRDGVYALLTGALFRSRYRGGDGVWRPTRFDQGFMLNALAGREFRLGADDLLGVNVRLAALGGERRSPVDEAASDAAEEVVFDEARAFEGRAPTTWVADVTVTYRRNGRRLSQVWALQVKNVLGAKDTAYDYNLRRGAVEEVREGYPLPVLSVKLEF